MPTSPADGRPDNPLYVVMSNVAIAATTGVAASESVPCEEADQVCIVYTITQTHTREVEVSDDDATWYALQGVGLNNAVAGSGVTAGPRALVVAPGGARFIRLKLSNTSAVAATATAKVMIR